MLRMRQNLSWERVADLERRLDYRDIEKIDVVYEGSIPYYKLYLSGNRVEYRKIE